MRHAVIFLLLFSLPERLVSGDGNDERVEALVHSGIEHVYNLSFERAEQDFGELVRIKPREPEGHFFLAMVLWWRILIDIENEQYDDEFHDRLDRVIDMCNERLKRDENDVTALFFKGGSLGFKGRLSTHRGAWLAAANAGRKALPIVQAAQARDPDNYDIQLGSGIYNYYAEVIPDEYPFVKPLLLFVPPGDRKKGIEQLTIASEKGRYASVEATYFLMQLYYQFEKNYLQALQLAQRLHTRFPNNMLFHKYLGRCYVSLGQWPKVQEVFADISDKARKGQRGYGPSTERESEYYLGVYEMSVQNYEKALLHFYRCDELSRLLDRDENSGFMVLANLKVGMIYDVQAKRDLAIRQYKKVLEMKEYKESYQQARKFLQAPYVQ